MANSHIASDRGLQLVNDARQDKSWNRTDQRFLDAAEISKATLNRFYAQQQPIKQETIVAICNAVGINNWKSVVDRIVKQKAAGAKDRGNTNTECTG
jgi:DNA-binding Xre family transcriptional regulator